LEKEFYRKVNKKAVELEGVNQELEQDIEKHTHLYEMM
jgi:hypothetical protein